MNGAREDVIVTSSDTEKYIISFIQEEGADLSALRQQAKQQLEQEHDVKLRLRGEIRQKDKDQIKITFIFKKEQ